MSDGYQRRKCSVCGEGLGFTESDPCEQCEDKAMSNDKEKPPEHSTGREIFDEWRKLLAQPLNCSDYEAVALIVAIDRAAVPALADGLDEAIRVTNGCKALNGKDAQLLQSARLQMKTEILAALEAARAAALEPEGKKP